LTGGNRRWIVRHAVKHPAKKGIARAIKIRGMAFPLHRSPVRERPEVARSTTCGIVPQNSLK
jgi:hypothetical protein